MSLAQLSGQINVDVRWQNGIIEQVVIVSTRPFKVTRLFEGKSLTEVLSMIPLLFSLCSVAQRVAAVRAAESALGLKAQAETEIVRELLVKAEAARELGFKVFSDWVPDRGGVRSDLLSWFTEVKADLGWALEVGAEPVVVKSDKYAELLNTLLCKAFAESAGADNTDDWLDQVVKQLPETEQIFFGEQNIQLLKEPAVPLHLDSRGVVSWIGSKLQGVEAEQFCATPDREGRCYESSLWSRSYAAGESYAVVSDNPIRNRLSALLEVLRRLPGEIGSMGFMLQRDAPEKGMGIVEASRGILIHRIEIEGDSVADSKVKDYKIVAPTEWNFHPQGTLKQMLTGVRVKREQVDALVSLLIKLIDPCVNWQLNVETADA